MSNYQHPLYNIWRGMLSRCYDSSNLMWEYYGEKGIAVCDEWLGNEGFLRFVEYMSERPSVKHSIDRVNYKGDYEPGNVRWATAAEQNRNLSSTVLITYLGKTQCLTDWALEYNMKMGTLRYRLKKGWSIEKALGTSLRQSVTITYKGETKTVAQWAETLQCDEETIRLRISKGWEIDRVLSKPWTEISSKVTVEYNGKTQSLKDWAVELNINYNTLYTRLHVNKWSVEKSFTQPVQVQK